jgi:signal transduction histidine kinase
MKPMQRTETEVGQPSTADPAPETAPSAQPNRRGTLLVCDDEDGPRNAVKAIFKGDYDLLLATNGPEAVALAQQNRVDVAVCDIRMRGMSGIEVLERLKFVDPGIEVVMMTAFETTDTLRQALRLHASDYINKPFDVSTVRTAVAQAMQRRRLETETSDSAGKIQELVAELQSQKIQEQISHSRNEIYASIIHDINGPLTVISGFVQLLNAKLADIMEPTPADLEFIKDRLKTITRQTTSCIEISRRYLSFLRRTDGEEGGKVGVNQILADLNQLIQGHPSLEGHQFKVHPLERDIGVRMNGTDLMQILRNLAVNAFQATHHPHTVEISGRVLNEPLDLTQLRDGPHDRVLNVENAQNTAPLLMLTVRDDGPGIPTEVLPKIFQPYFTTKSAKQGTGLGLSIIMRLIKEARGVLHLHTAPGSGTSFTIYLPGVEASAPTKP